MCQRRHPPGQLICSRLNIRTLDKKKIKKDAGKTGILEVCLREVASRIAAGRTQTRGSLAKDLMSIQPPSANSAQSLR